MRRENRGHDARNEQPTHPPQESDWVGGGDEHGDAREKVHEDQEPDAVHLPELGVR